MYSPIGSAFRVTGISGLAQMGFRQRRKKMNIQILNGDDALANLPVEKEIRDKLFEINDGSSTAVRIRDALQTNRMMVMSTHAVQADLYREYLPKRIRVIE